MNQLELFTQAEQKFSPRNAYEAVVYFMAHLDAEVVGLILDDDKTYQDLPKHLFISKLRAAFEQFEKAGDQVLKLHKGGCSGCNKGCRGFTFLGKNGHFMDVLFEVKEYEILDIYQCFQFENDEEVEGKSNCIEINPIDYSLLEGSDLPF